MFLLSYLVLINLHENLRGRRGGGRLEGTLDVKAVKLLYSYEKS